MNDKIFETILFNRETMVSLLENYTEEQVNFIPKNFKNSLIWNIGHVLVTEQLLIYKLSGLPLKINENLVPLFAKGTKPDTMVDIKQIQMVKELLVSTVLTTRKDYHDHLFQKYQPYTTSTGIVLNNVEDALLFNCFHEGIHLGIILSLKKLAIV
ncbi:MAG: DinB family protein [Flavobacteriaceae bacterium]|nr:DinB family protein [Flavobacteriaceae bacterium]